MPLLLEAGSLNENTMLVLSFTSFKSPTFNYVFRTLDLKEKEP